MYICLRVMASNWLDYTCMCFAEKLPPAGTAAVASTLLANSDAGMKLFLYFCTSVHICVC